MEKKLQTAIDTLKKALSLSEIITALIAPEKVLRENLTPSEAESAALLTKNNIPLPESFYTVTIPAALVQTGIDTLKAMMPSRKGKGGGRAKGSTEPVKADPALGWITSKKRNLRTAAKNKEKTFCFGKRFVAVFPELFEKSKMTLNFDPCNPVNYAAAMEAYGVAIAKGGSINGAKIPE